jgi:hypothetical protein
VGKYVLLSKSLSYLLSVAVAVNKEENLSSQCISAIYLVGIETNTCKLKNGMRNYSRTVLEPGTVFMLSTLLHTIKLCHNISTFV